MDGWYAKPGADLRRRESFEPSFSESRGRRRVVQYIESPQVGRTLKRETGTSTAAQGFFQWTSGAEDGSGVMNAMAGSSRSAVGTMMAWRIARPSLPVEVVPSKESATDGG